MRAARTLTSSPPVDPFGTSPILPPEAGFAGAFEPNLYLLFTRAVDRVAGGGMASLRALSLGPSAALLLAGLLLAWELSAGDRRRFAFGALFLAGSAWLLRVGRWGWFNLTTAALLAAALALALRARRQGRLAPALAAGLLLGLAQYGYLVSRAGLAFALLALVAALPGLRSAGGRAAARTATAVLGTALLVALPLLVHLASDGERAAERVRELAPPGGVAGLPALLPGNVRDLAGLFFASGDPNPRHAEPGRPLVPLPAGLAIAAGLVLALRDGGAPRVAALGGLAVLATNLVTKGGPEAANSFRAVAAAAPLLVLAGGAWAALAVRLERALPTAGAPLAAGLLVALSAWDAAAFLRWGRSAETDRLFGAAERRLADRLRSLGAGSDADVLVSARAFDERTTYVELLLARADSGARGVRVEHAGLAIPPPRLAVVPGRDLLYLDLDAGDCAGAAQQLRGVVAERVAEDAGRPPLCVVRIGADRGREVAGRLLDRFPRVAPSGSGALAVDEEGLWGLGWEGRGGTGLAFVRLSPGRYRVEELIPAGSRLAGLAGPDGFPRRPPADG